MVTVTGEDIRKDHFSTCDKIGTEVQGEFDRITVDPAVATGKPCIRGLRLPVSRLLGLLAAGESEETILAAYPYLESGDIRAALRYAAYLAEDGLIEATR